MQRYSILGPPGTGKTTEIVNRIKIYLEKGINPGKIGLTTFSKSAANELAKRSKLNSNWIGTLHSMAFKIANITRDSVFTGQVVKEFGEHVGIPIAGGNVIDGDKNIELGDEFLALYMLAAAKIESLENIYTNSSRPGDFKMFKYFCDGLDEYKKYWGYVDFNDMLKLALDKKDIPDLNVLFIDEAQDLSPLQWELVNYWTEYINVVHIVGDDLQAIYSWGGADPHGIAKWTKKWESKTEVLNQSYRIPVKVHEISEQISNKIKNKIEKEYKPRDEIGEFETIGDFRYIDDIKHGEDIAILYRNHFVREEFEYELIDKGTPYKVVSGKPSWIDTPYAKCVKAFIKAQDEFHEFGNFNLSKQLKNGSRWLLPQTYQIIMNENRIPHSHWTLNFQSGPYMQYLDLVEKQYDNLENIVPTIILSTIHGFKGMEADRVILIDSLTQRTMDSFAIDPDSEYRVFYVGVTRAKRKLDIVIGDNCLITNIIV